MGSGRDRRRAAAADAGEFAVTLAEDVAYNEQAGTTAFALIRQGRRVFGADNPGGWHVHPLADPGQHVPLSSAMSFADFVAEVEQSVAD